MLSPFDGRRANPEAPEHQPRKEGDTVDYDRKLLDFLKKPMHTPPLPHEKVMRCRTGYVLSDTQKCQECGAARKEQCRYLSTLKKCN